MNNNITGRLGEYKIIRELGAGNFGAVYLVENIQTEEKFVAKRVISVPTLRRTVQSSQRQGLEEGWDREEIDKKVRDEVRDLNREIAIMYRLKKDCGKYFICVRDITEKRPYYIIMDYVPDSEDLDVLITKGELTTIQKLKISSYLIKGLKVIHENNIVHRDIKPSNILIDEKYNSYYIDFGLSCSTIPKNRSDMRCLNTIQGDRAFMPDRLVQNFKLAKGVPEKVKLLKFADVYALCMTLIILFVGTEPITARKAVNNIIKKETTNGFMDKFIHTLLYMGLEHGELFLSSAIQRNQQR